MLYFKILNSMKISLYELLTLKEIRICEHFADNFKFTWISYKPVMHNQSKIHVILILHWWDRILNLNFLNNCIYGACNYLKHFNKMWMWIYLWSFVIDTLYKSVHTDIFKLHLIFKKKKEIESSPFKHQIELKFS